MASCIQRIAVHARVSAICSVNARCMRTASSMATGAGESLHDDKAARHDTGHAEHNT
ncbi:hypothetical protein APS_2145 [Acetobacter pasteurianus subsp. pasteurianus LMG 1262 = NBRC 106471]|nr:hypothetical protein APS_2145 [Acetobacter pasteurianus subsp. pasteurianus LMG 1262 = NBRC 106471]